MSLLNTFTYLLDLCTGLPSQATFIEKHIVPAKPDDKYYNDRCSICWGDYDAEHPRSKIPCGHIFGRDCIHAMVKGPIGELCPYCKTKLFRPGLAKLVGKLLVQGLVIYESAVLRMIYNFHRIEGRLMQQFPWLVTPLSLLYDGPAGIVSVFVTNFTNLGIRNPKQELKGVFAASILLPMLLHNGTLCAPLLLLIYLVCGLHYFLWSLFAVDFLLTFCIHIVMWEFEMGLIGQADRATVKFLSFITFLAREVTVFWMLVPGTFSVALKFVWAILGAVPW